MLPIFLSIVIDCISEATLLVPNGLESKKDQEVCDSPVVRTEQTHCMYQDTHTLHVQDSMLSHTLVLHGVTQETPECM